MNPIYPISISIGIYFLLTILGIRKSPVFPKINSVHVLFRERFLSGRTNGLTGTYRNILEVVLTDQELWIRTFLPFSGLAVLFGAVHKVQVSEIRGIEIRGTETTIYFTNDQLKEVHFSITFNKQKFFIQTLQQVNPAIRILEINR
ncbi:hypothetical protein [Fluviicola sp.]|uniref:hypothetical protein n=1 Tax=Fluviicola sp. TaxID=1917219 RepID=UPI00262158E2|nr:hypothetical protein [Fluviicola sp.]